MRVQAPGKVVISGAYAVLEGAPALVSAVDRYVTACSTEPAGFHAPEVAAALRHPPYAGFAAPNYDASALRDGDTKLGIGSSAAILVASLGCLRPEALETADGLESLFAAALLAHRQAQGGGSGIDVAVSCFGGTLSYQLEPASPERPTVSRVQLPPGLHLEVWGSDRAASTKTFVAAVRSLKETAPSEHEPIMNRLRAGAELAQNSCHSENANEFLRALSVQSEALADLGARAGVPIQTQEVRRLASLAKGEGACVLPAGAGGGDVALWAGLAPPSAALLSQLSSHGHRRLELELGAQGVHRL